MLSRLILRFADADAFMPSFADFAIIDAAILLRRDAFMAAMSALAAIFCHDISARCFFFRARKECASDQYEYSG